MNKTQQQFFALLRSGLWNRQADEALFSEEADWKAILNVAAMQTVCGVLYDGISMLPAEQQPPKEIMRQLYQMVVRIEQSHQLVNKRLTDIVEMLQSEGINPILLKGQGIAQNYPEPLRRQCGDIDVFIGKENYGKACDLLKKEGLTSLNESESHKHYHFEWDGVHIELHRIVERLHNPVCNKRFQLWIKHMLRFENLRVWQLDKKKIYLPPVSFDAIYMLNHIYHHFVSGGVGLRQLCDWSAFLQTFNDQIDREGLLKNLRAFGLLKPWQLFGCIAVSRLGLPQSAFPFYNEKYINSSRKILDKILQTGNFGFYNPDRSERPPGFLTGKLHSLKQRQKWLIDIFPILPKEVLIFYTWYWGIGIINIIKRRGA